MKFRALSALLCCFLLGLTAWQSIGPAELTAGSVKSLAWDPAGELFVITTGGVWSGRPE
jgi:hypothetical protein